MDLTDACKGQHKKGKLFVTIVKNFQKMLCLQTTKFVSRLLRLDHISCNFLSHADYPVFLCGESKGLALGDMSNVGRVSIMQGLDISTFAPRFTSATFELFTEMCSQAVRPPKFAKKFVMVGTCLALLSYTSDTELADVVIKNRVLELAEAKALETMRVVKAKLLEAWPPPAPKDAPVPGQTDQGSSLAWQTDASSIGDRRECALLLDERVSKRFCALASHDLAFWDSDSASGAASDVITHEFE